MKPHWDINHHCFLSRRLISLSPAVLPLGLDSGGTVMYSSPSTSLCQLATVTSTNILTRTEGVAGLLRTSLSERPPGKMSPQFIGPYTVDSPTAVKLRLPPALQIHPVFHVSQVKPVLSSLLCPPPDPPPPTLLIDRHPAFTVRRILDVRWRGRGQQFLVDWEGYRPEECSWVPRSLILDPVMISDFFR